MGQPIDTSLNSSFSLLWPGLQLAIDSTSLGEFKTCPRKYFYTIVLGYQPRGESIHLEFGLLIHGAVERFHHAKAGGWTHDESIDQATNWALRESWDAGTKKPRAIFTSDPNKNRFTAIRTLVWYFDQYRDDALETSIRADGRPAVELSFSFDSGLRSRLTGEPFLFCGHLDRLATMNSVPYIPDCKTTKHQLDSRYWAQFNPSNQFGMYDLAGAVALGQPSRGIIVDGMQILVGSSRFGRFLISKDEALRQEWLDGAHWWVASLERCAEELPVAAEAGDPSKAFPMNDKSCDMWGGCSFREVCSRSPAARPAWLEANFKKRTWDPLQRRGDI